MQSDENNYESMEYNICLSSETDRLISGVNLIEMKFFDVKSFSASVLKCIWLMFLSMIQFGVMKVVEIPSRPVIMKSRSMSSIDQRQTWLDYCSPSSSEDG
jgi:hypothetical protein